MRQQLVDFLGDITIVVSPALKIMNINKSFFDFLQFTEEELIGKNIKDIVPDYNLDGILSSGLDYQPFIDTFLVSKNGDRIPISVSASAVRDDQGILLAIMLLLHEIKGRNQKKVTLLDMHNRYRSMTENALDAVIVMNAEGVVIEWNRQAESQFGWSADEAVGQSLADLIIPHALREKHQQGLKRFIETGEGRILNKRIELSALHRDGHQFPVELTVSPMQWGDTYLFSAFVRDITIRKNTEKELIYAKEAAETAAQAKSNFLAMMSHEIRTPLNGVIGMTELLKETELTVEQQEFLEYLIKSESILLALINDILDFSKIDSGNVELELEPFDLKVCIEETFDILSGLARDKQLALTYSIEPDIPQKIMGDITRLRQILINLIGNSIKFTEAGGVYLTVKMLESLNENQCKLLFTVKDTGIGISEDKKKHLFQPFSQLDSSTTRKYGGTGLGLAICKNLVEQMGGDIWSESSAEGATFSFFITTAPAASGFGVIETTESELFIEGNPINILIAEDNEINQKVLKHILEQEGLYADVVQNGFEVLEAVKFKFYDLIFMDLHMPGMDGIEATQRLRRTLASESQPKIIAVTANAFTDDKEKCIAAGMNGYISKPINRSKLVKALRDIL